jgi:outer membrane receptor protein involved in Fe transport
VFTDIKQMRSQLFLSKICVGLAFVAATCLAQTLDTGILGTVTDPNGAVIPGASVTISEPETGLVRTVITGPEGGYEVRYLRPGHYVIEVRAAGFRSERHTGIDLQISRLARIDMALQVGEVRETVEVSSAGAILQTENATLGGVVAPERVVNLPLNGRNFLQLSNLTPGVVVREESNAERTRVLANGARDVWMQVNINGITAVNNRHNFVNFYPSIDAIQEFKVQSGNYSAEYGGNAGANVNVQLRSGTNQFHGAAFEFLRNNALDARGYFRPQPLPKDILHRNQFGAVLAGPVRKDKTFFMVDYEGQRTIIERAATSVVLTPAQRQGNFSALSTPITDPLSGSAFPGNVIPTSRLNPVSVNLINRYTPLPNVPGAVNFSGVTKNIVNVDQGLARLDHTFSVKDQIAVHFIYAAKDLPSTDLNPNFFYNATFPNTNFGAQHVHTFSPTVLNEVRFGWIKGHIQRLSPRTNTDFTIESLGISGLKVGGPDGRPLRKDEQGFPVISVEGFLGMGDGAASSNLDDSRTYQVVDNFSVIRGAHSIKVGADLRRLRDDATTNNWPFGNMAFTRDIAGYGAAAYLLGYPRTTLTPEGVPISKVRQWRWAAYFQDDWKVTPNLTLNLGIRYDLFGQPHEINAVSRTLRWDLDPKGPILWPDAGKQADIYINEYKNISPRVGLAYRFGSKTVLRSGYGFFRTGAHFDNMNILQLNPPIAGSLTVTNPAVNPPATIQNPVPREIFPVNPIYNVVTAPIDRQRRNAYVQNWNIQVSRQITGNDVLDIGWVGSKATHLDTSLNNYNNPAPSLLPFDQSRRPYPQYNRIRLIDSGGNAIYHSLQSRYEHRFTKGLSVTAAYTWSHLIDDSAQTVNRGACQCQDPLNRRAERASGLDDIRHRFVTGYVFEIPWGKSLKSATGFLFAGWQLGGIITLQSGSPFNVLQSGDSQNVEFSSWERPNVIAAVSPTLSHRDPALWFNTAAFSRSVGMFGTSPRDPLTGPILHTTDLSVSKTFRLPYAESHQILFRTEFFNSFNSPQFDVPGGTLGTGTFGVVTGVRSDNRQIQFALKYIF